MTRGVIGESLGGKQRCAKNLGQAFEPERQVDGGADHGEIQSIQRADIAVDDVADVQADPGFEDGPFGPGAAAVQRVEPGQRGASGGERAGRGIGFIMSVDTKDREHAVADELQHVAPLGSDRTRHTLEIIVQHLDNVAGRELVG